MTTINFSIDGIPVSVPKGTTVYNAAKQLGIDLPIFCYQDRMPPFGACRVCLVEVEKMPKLQTSCTLEATEGMVVKTQSAIAAEGRKDILEFLLINHPLDCPICDRGGECPLQDQTLKFGPGMSRFFEEKRRFIKPLPLGPVLMLDRERCIQCARCTRFGELISGDHALEFIERGYRMEVGTPDGAPAESKFIGNTIMICPVGALTSQVYRFRARPWDNDTAQTTCTLCPVGCSMLLDARDGEIMRTRSCENRDVNDIWLCDKGWFGYEFAAHPERLQQPLIRKGGALQPASWDEALSLVASKIKEAKAGGKLAALGGNPLTTEENYLFQKLMREGAGVNHVDHRVGMPLFSDEEEGFEAGMETEMKECEELSYAILLGIDLTEEFPLIWLRLKQAINRGAKVIFIGHYAPEIALHLTQTHLHPPGNEVDQIEKHLPSFMSQFEDQRGAIFIGRQYLASPQRKKILAKVYRRCKDKKNLAFNVMEGKGNSMGARLAGMHPTYGPLKQKLSKPGLNALQIMEEAGKNGWAFLYVAGANPAVKYSEVLWKEMRAKLGFLVVQDLFLTETAQEADVVLPSLSFLEKQGTFINIEGRIQQLQPGKNIPKNLYSDGEIFSILALKLNVTSIADRRFHDQLQREPRVAIERRAIESAGTAPQPQVSELVATFAPRLFDHGVRMNHNTGLVQMANDSQIRMRREEALKRNLRDGEQVLVSTGGKNIEGTLAIDDGVAPGTLVLPLGFAEVPVHNLSNNLLNGLAVRVERI